LFSGIIEENIACESVDEQYFHSLSCPISRYSDIGVLASNIHVPLQFIVTRVLFHPGFSLGNNSSMLFDMNLAISAGLLESLYLTAVCNVLATVDVDHVNFLPYVHDSLKNGAGSAFSGDAGQSMPPVHCLQVNVLELNKIDILDLYDSYSSNLEAQYNTCTRNIT
jgi:hypothetical protein